MTLLFSKFKKTQINIDEIKKTITENDKMAEGFPFSGKTSFIKNMQVILNNITNSIVDRATQVIEIAQKKKKSSSFKLARKQLQKKIRKIKKKKKTKKIKKIKKIKKLKKNLLTNFRRNNGPSAMLLPNSRLIFASTPEKKEIQIIN
jgi:hypothetical protein